MPELPEVETIRLGLLRRMRGKRIRRVVVRKKKLITGSVAAFMRDLTGNEVVDITRRGKLLIFHLKQGGYLLIHLKMTGQLIYEKGKQLVAGGHQWPPISGGLPNKYTHVQFDFADDSHLYFNDQRQFGYLQIVDVKGLERALANYGMDPLTDDISWADFYDLLRGRKTSIKAALLNQKLVAGIGNIYADEILFVAGVRPGRRVSTLTSVELKKVYGQIPKILHKALKHGGTTFQDYRDADGSKGNFMRLLKVYGRTGEVCKRCKDGVIVKKHIAQRGTHYCPRCQV